MGDASGAGPEILVKALTRPDIRVICRPIVIGDAATIRQAARIVGLDVPVESVVMLSASISAPPGKVQ